MTPQKNIHIIHHLEGTEVIHRQESMIVHFQVCNFLLSFSK